ncbi:MAG: winged helix-turn-helix domain-containing protein [Bacteroidales bacterium]|nr:winged helix-turn-helix domain-containing protein [Bacteroidales bacterium]
MLDTLVTSKTRLKLILKFFLNPCSSAYLRELAEEFGESSNAVRLELNRFEQAGLLKSEANGNKKLYRANVIHPLYKDIHSIISKTIGIDQIVDEVVAKLGDVEEAYITGDFAT